MKNQDIVGEALASVLPQDDRPWFRQPHLLQLNLILLVPLLSSAVAGYDGRRSYTFPLVAETNIHFRFSDEWPSVNHRMEKLLWEPCRVGPWCRQCCSVHR